MSVLAGSWGPSCRSERDILSLPWQGAGIWLELLQLTPHWLSADVKTQLAMVRPGLGMLSIFICLKGTKKDLKLQSTNYYVYFDTDMDKA